jgi:hypothetical protein
MPHRFFAENVGNSAWGLAIHTKSRLIAVGSNSHEIQVFALALATSSQEKSQNRLRLSSRDRNAARLEKFPILKQKIPRAVDGQPSRNYNFRRILKLDARGDNIPSVSFADNIYGEAETVVAKDVKGALWFLHIWNGTWQRLATFPEESDPNRHIA